MILYGIPNCNTVKKAKDWLNVANLVYEFHDFKKSGVTVDQLNKWCTKFGWEKVVNKKGTTWKKQPLSIQEGVISQESAVQFLLHNTSAIKRPVLEIRGKAVKIGFDVLEYERLFEANIG
jgi:arsenate reductase